VAKIVWPCGWVCQAVRARGVKRTAAAPERGAAGGRGDGVDGDVARVSAASPMPDEAPVMTATRAVR
jgi:hypothetical protein